MSPSPPAFLLSPSPPALPFDSNPMSGVPGFAYAVGVLFLVCVGAYFTVKFLYGRGFQGRLGVGKRLIRVLDRYTLAAQRYLLVVEIGGKAYLIGVTEQQVTFLTPLDLEALAKDIAWMEQAQPNFTPFNSYLSAFSRRWKKDKKEPPDG